MAVDYTNLPAAIRAETLESLRNLAENARSNAAEHRRSAKYHQSLADRENAYADRDEERARQWQAQLDFAESAVPLGEGPELAADVDPVTGRDYAEEAWQRADAEREGAEEAAAEQTALSQTPLAVAFGAAPVEYFDAAEAEDVRQIRREMAAEAGDWDPADEYDGGVR